MDALTQEHSSALAVIGVALVAFPKLALGLLWGSGEVAPVTREVLRRA